MNLQEQYKRLFKGRVGATDKKILKETYRNEDENLEILYTMIKTGGDDKEEALAIIQAVEEDYDLKLTGKNLKKDLTILEKDSDAAEYFDEQIEMALDDGFGRARGASMRPDY